MIHTEGDEFLGRATIEIDRMAMQTLIKKIVKGNDVKVDVEVVQSFEMGMQRNFSMKLDQLRLKRRSTKSTPSHHQQPQDQIQNSLAQTVASDNDATAPEKTSSAEMCTEDALQIGPHQASQRSGATTVFRGPTSPSRPGHDFSALVRPGLRSTGLGPLQVPTGDRWLPILVVELEIRLYPAVFPAVHSNLVIVGLNILYDDVISASQTEVL
ncbi:hypothetical protein BDD12DRAFT_889284 [Trichophaea hybrida]|nr:hypothetical protein BDD12DRAFT_889284 [Trichophaea hybrida]